MQYWKKLTAKKRQHHIRKALEVNVNFAKDASLGYPASNLDNKVFSEEAPFLRDTPILQSFVANPNNIGCHTLGTSEKAFEGTQQIEREVLNVIAVDIFNASPNSFDGYITPGGTEANIQAIWMYRNYFINELKAHPSEITIIASEDTHYSIPKAANLLMLDWLKIPVDFDQRNILESELETYILEAKNEGKKYFIIVANMGTTMFGSVDNPDTYTSFLKQHELIYKLHIDAAYGGFVYPFSNDNNQLDFQNPNISSITIDTHKMLQAPYGTGIFICRKGLIENVLTKETEYVEGMDLTLCGSRSGANAVAVWMILFTYGSHGWFEKISVLQMRTTWFCKELEQLGIEYFRNSFMNIVKIKTPFIDELTANKFDLVPQKHDTDDKWHKVIIMEHVEIEQLALLITELKRKSIKT